MLGEAFHVSINGIKYRLAEDAEGTHYRKSREPLRAPVSNVVLGEKGKFHLRPDILEWVQTDFQGGEGQQKWTPDTANKYWYGENVNPFVESGNLVLGPDYEVTQDSTGVADFAETVMLASAMSSLWAMQWEDPVLYAVIHEWDSVNEKWGAEFTQDFGTSPGFHIAGARDKMFFATPEITALVQSFDGTDFAFHGTDFVKGGVYGPLRSYCYNVVMEDGALEVGEFNVLDPISSTIIYDLEAGSSGAGFQSSYASVGPNALYVLAHPNPNETAVHRITPTTPAAGGFGEEIFRLMGFIGEAVFYHFGLVLVIGTYTGAATDDKEWVLLYIDDTQDNPTFGIVGTFPPSRNSTQPPLITTGRGFLSYFMAADENDDWHLMAYSIKTGGMAGLAKITEPQASWNGDPSHASLVIYDDDVFWPSVDASGNPRVYRILKDTYAVDTGIWESSIFDNDILDDKILLSIKVTTDPLLEDTSVVVKYQLNQDGVWLTAGTMDATDQTDEDFVISTDALTREYSNLQLRLELANSGTNTITPSVRSIRTYSTVAAGIPIWDLLLSATDELGALQNRAFSGTTLIANIETAGDSGQVVALLDGYYSRDPSVSTEYDVVVDAYQTILDRAGEGVVSCRLRAVI